MEENVWKSDIYHQLLDRNKTQTLFFQNIIASHNKLFESANSLKNENLQLSMQNEKLRLENHPSNVNNGTNTSQDASRLHDKIQLLEQKLLTQQDELTELLRRKGENSQNIIDLTAQVQEKDKLLSAKDIRIGEYVATITMLRAETHMYEASIKELQHLNQVIRDEHQALQLAYNVIEDKLRKLQDDHSHVLSQFMCYKSKDAEKMNEENDNFVSDGTRNVPRLFSSFRMFRKKYAKVQKELEDACKDDRGASVDGYKEMSITTAPIYKCTLPSKPSLNFEAHDGEVNAVAWAPDDQQIVATGGIDRKVQLWSISKGSYKNKGALVGSNAAIMSVSFNSSGTMLLGTSNDFASRVWGTTDFRIKHTLTGHSGKVMSGKFLEQTKVVTGSYDRTLKIWDLNSRACIETKFAGSSCNDLVTVDGAGASIISGHYDKRIRFWDTRADCNANDILLQGKITSLDLSRDSNYLLSCVRDDTLKLIDLRMNQIMSSFSSEGFKVGCDWSRVTFSPNDQYVAAGSADGSIYIWNVSNTKVETVLSDHRSAVTAVSWSPFGTYLISVDRTKRAIVWGDE